MALSNWDTLAFDSNGISCSGTFVHSKLKSFIDIYKNWIYVGWEKMWEEDGLYSKPIIAKIHEGRVNLAGFEIVSKRGPQEGIFVYSEYKKWEDKSCKTFRFAGIGCYGFVDHVEIILGKLGRLKELEDNGNFWFSGVEYKDKKYNIHYIQNGKTKEKIIYHDDSTQGEYKDNDDWVGVKKETYNEFIEWLCTLGDDEFDKDYNKWFDKVKYSKAVRYNQGNAWFTKRLGTPLESSVVGEVSEQPIMIKILKK